VVLRFGGGSRAGQPAAIAFCAAIVAGALLRPGPQFPAGARIGRSRYALAMFADRGPCLVNLAYFGHMWELYALWTWLPTFLAVSRTTTTGQSAPGGSGIDAFLAIGVAGLAGCLLGGWAADRFGRAATAAAALTVSGACCLLSPMFFTADRPWLLAFTAVWGAAVIADSGVFSTLLSELADRRYIGTALRRLGRGEEAAAAYDVARSLTANPVEQACGVREVCLACELQRWAGASRRAS
jgi:predicted MFS family arabinose efflux permease